MTISLQALHEKREQLKAGLTQIGDLRRGFLHCPIPQVWQAKLPLCTERLPGTWPR